MVYYRKIAKYGHLQPICRKKLDSQVFGGAFLMNFEAKTKTKPQISQERCCYIIPNSISSQPGAS